MIQDARSTPTLEALRAACAQGQEDERQRLDDGPLVCHVGYPAPAVSGTVALKLADLVTVIREADIVRLGRDKTLYRVWTRSDANVILRLEKVAKAGGEPEPCGCEDETTEGVLAREIDLDIGPVTMAPCKTQRICTTVFGRPYCFNVVVCRFPGGEPTVDPEEE